MIRQMVLVNDDIERPQRIFVQMQGLQTNFLL